MKYYAAGWNQPGYMPETEVQHFDHFDDAREYLVDEVTRAADDANDAGDKNAEGECDEATGEISTWEESDGDYFQVFCDGYVYWINEIPEGDYRPEE